MKGWSSILNFLFGMLDGLAHVLLSPLTFLIALGFILLTGVIGRQLKNERDSDAPWIRTA